MIYQGQEYELVKKPKRRMAGFVWGGRITCNRNATVCTPETADSTVLCEEHARAYIASKKQGLLRRIEELDAELEKAIANSNEYYQEVYKKKSTYKENPDDRHDS